MPSTRVVQDIESLYASIWQPCLGSAGWMVAHPSVRIAVCVCVFVCYHMRRCCWSFMRSQSPSVRDRPRHFGASLVVLVSHKNHSAFVCHYVFLFHTQADPKFPRCVLIEAVCPCVRLCGHAWPAHTHIQRIFRGSLHIYITTRRHTHAGRSVCAGLSSATASRYRVIVRSS